MNTNEGIKRGNSRTKLYQTLFISLNYRLQTELNVHPLINFFLLRDNQFTSVGLHSTIVLKTQVHSNTPCWGLKNLKKKTKKKRENYHNAEIKAQSISSSFFSSTLWKNLNIYSSRPNFKWTPYVEANWANVAMFSLFQNIPVFGEHLYYAKVITAIASFSDSKFLFQQKL